MTTEPAATADGSTTGADDNATTVGEANTEPTGSTGGGEPVPQDGTPPSFTVSPIDLSGTYDPVTASLGALSCSMVPKAPQLIPAAFGRFACRRPPPPPRPSAR